MNTKLKLFLLLFVALSTGSCSVRKKMYKHLDNAPEGFYQRWTVKTHADYKPGKHPAEQSSPVLIKGMVLQGSRAQGLGLYRQKDGKLVWLFKVKGGVDGTPAVDEKINKVYIGGNDGKFYCLNLFNGSEIWSVDLKARSTSKPLIHGARLFHTGSDQMLTAFDRKTGKKLWNFKKNLVATTVLKSTTIRGAGTPVIWRDLVIAGFGDGTLVGFNYANGDKLWEVSLKGRGKFVDVDSSPQIVRGHLYVTSFDGELFKINPKSGEILKTYNSGGARDLLFTDQYIYLPSSDGYVHKLRISDLNPVWKFKLEHGIPTGVKLFDEGLFVTTSHRFIYLVDDSDGFPLYRSDMGGNSGIYSKIAASGKNIYVFSAFGNLIRYDLLDSVLRAEISEDRFHDSVH